MFKTYLIICALAINSLAFSDTKTDHYIKEYKTFIKTSEKDGYIDAKSEISSEQQEYKKELDKNNDSKLSFHEWLTRNVAKEKPKTFIDFLLNKEENTTHLKEKQKALAAISNELAKEENTFTLYETLCMKEIGIDEKLIKRKALKTFGNIAYYNVVFNVFLNSKMFWEDIDKKEMFHSLDKLKQIESILGSYAFVQCVPSVKDLLNSKEKIEKNFYEVRNGFRILKRSENNYITNIVLHNFTGIKDFRNFIESGLNS